MSDLEGQIRTEQQRLYEVASLTDEMEDDEAQVLLEWGSDQVARIAGDGSQLEGRARKLRRLIQEISYFVGNVERMEAHEKSQYLERVYQSASDLNYPVRQDLMSGVLEQFEGQNPGDVLIILIAWLENDSLLVDALESPPDA